MNDDSTIIADRLRVLLAWHQTINTQEALAQAMNVSQGSVSKWCRGETLPSLARLAGICDVFGISADFMLGRTDAKSGFPADAWIVDLDYADEVEKTGREPSDGGLAAPVPRRHQVMSSSEYFRFKQALDRKLGGGR